MSIREFGGGLKTLDRTLTGDEYSLDFVFDLGEPTRSRMLEILFGADNGVASHIYRVRFGEN